MNFASDNWAGAHPAIAKRLAQESSAYAPAYGNSDLDKRIERKFSEVFERDVTVFFVATGTAANALALATINRPGGVTFCHREAHMFEDECGAPEFFAQGSRLAPIDGTYGKIDPENLHAEIQRFPLDFVHAGQPMAISITQATEIGTVYELSEIDRISQIARKFDLPLHMDGARFANAVSYLNTTPAEMSWRSGVDILSFGGTKNGCWCAEALIFMHREHAQDFPYIRKRSGHLFSKTRFIASQFDAYLEDGRWLELAKHANKMANLLSQGIAASSKARLAWQCQSNEVFCITSKNLADFLQSKGAVFHRWNFPHSYSGRRDETEILLRLVTSFATEQGDIDQFLSLLDK